MLRMLRWGSKNLRHEEGIKGFPFSLKPLAISLFLSLFLLLFNANPVLAGNVTLAWNAPTERVNGTPVTSTEIKGYNIHYGTASGSYTQTQPITGNVTTYTFTNLPNGVNYYFAVSAIDNADIESGYSSEACKTIGTTTTTCVTTTISNGGSNNNNNNNNNNFSTGGDTEIGGGGGGCGFIKNNGKGQKAKGEGLSLIIMLIITLTGIALAKRRTGNITATKEGVLVMETRKNSLIKIAAISFLLTIFWSASAYAQPNVTSFSGSLTNKGTLVITGTGFGTKATPAPLKWDDFESGALGANLGNGWWSTAVGGSGPLPKYDNTVLRTGSTKSVLQDYTYPGVGSTGGNRQYGAAFGLVNQNNNKYYISFWRYLATAGSPVRNFKTFSLRGGPAGAWDNPEARMDTYAIYGNSYGYFLTTDCSGATSATKDGQYFSHATGIWMRFEFYIDTGTIGGTDGIYWHARDGVERVRLSNQVMRTSSCAFSNLYINGYFSRESGDNDASAYIWNDDVYIDTTQARIEIGNAPTWATSTHREIQIPSAWSDTSITITLNKGSLTNFNNAYLYVVDANGNVNTNGLPLCPSCLKPPNWQ